MEDTKEEVVTKTCMSGKIVKTRIDDAGHMVRMKCEILQKYMRQGSKKVAENDEDNI